MKAQLIIEKSRKFEELSTEERISIIGKTPIDQPRMFAKAVKLNADNVESPYVVGGNQNTSLDGVSVEHKQNWLDIDLYAQLVANQKQAMRGTPEYLNAYLDAILVCGVTVQSSDFQTFKAGSGSTSLSDTCINVMGELAGGKVSSAIKVAVDGMKDSKKGYNVFSSSSRSESGQGYGMSSIEVGDEVHGKIEISTYNWTARNVKRQWSQWFFVKQDETEIHLTYLLVNARLNYARYQRIEPRILNQIESYQESLIVEIDPKPAS